MNVRLKRARELAGYAVQLTKDEGLPTMLKRGAGFINRLAGCFLSTDHNRYSSSFLFSSLSGTVRSSL